MFSFRELNINLSKKILLQTYFIIFIFLNIIDFLNIIAGDLDFFKKILSWTVIGYIFYKASFTKIMIGKRIKIYDLLFIIGFAFMSIVKSIILYVNSISEPELVLYPVFTPLILWIKSLDPSFLLYTTFIIGFLLVLVLSISLLLNNRISEESFIGSLKIRDGFFKYILEQLTLIVMAIFFGLILFNLFMEWFALAVDSIILVLGMGYYLLKFVHRHTNSVITNYTKMVANTGNDFFQEIIRLFSQKSKILIAISFLLTLHSLVDAGVYLVPYSIGTQNALYFEGLGVDTHNPLFNFFNPPESMFFKDLANANNDVILGVPILLSYFLSLFFFFAMMALPFFIFYNNVKNNKVIFHKYFAIALLSAIMFYVLLIFLPQAHPPLLMQATDPDSNIKGIDIITVLMTENSNPYEIVSAGLIYFVILLFLFFRYSKYKEYFHKIILFCVLVFFLFYIGIFFTTYIHVEYNKVKVDFLEFEVHKKNNEILYTSLKTVYDDERYYKEKRNRWAYIDNTSKSQMIITPFSNIETIDNSNMINEKQNHMDFLHIVLLSENSPYTIRITDLNRSSFESNDVYEIKSSDYIEIKENEVEMIYFLGPNIFDIREEGGILRIEPNPSEINIRRVVDFREPSALDQLKKSIEYIRLSFTAVFYILAMITFSVFFIRRNLLER